MDSKTRVSDEDEAAIARYQEAYKLVYGEEKFIRVDRFGVIWRHGHHLPTDRQGLEKETTALLSKARRRAEDEAHERLKDAAGEMADLVGVLASLNEHANQHLAEPILRARALLARIEGGVP